MADRKTRSLAGTSPYFTDPKEHNNPLTESENADSNSLQTVHRRQCNARLPVARIPPEIFSEIFIYHRDASDATNRVSIRRITWIYVAHVSHYWRSLALSDPRLWTTLNLRFPKLVAHFSLHFSSLPLRVVLSPQQGYDEKAPASAELALHSVCDTTNPITVVELCGEYRELSRFTTPLFTRAANTLVVLQIQLHMQSFVRSDRVISGLEGTPFPNLRVLSLDNVKFSMHCTMIRSCARSLLEFTLKDFSFRKRSEICALSSLLKLERLSLDVSFSPFLQQDDATTFSLPALNSLSLCVEANDCILLLACIQRPSACSTSVRLVATNNGHRGPALADLVRHIPATNLCLRFVAHSLRIESGRHTLQLPLAYSPNFDFTWEQLAGGVRAVLSSSTDLALGLAWEPDAGDITAEALIEVCSGAARVRTLEIDGAYAPLDVLGECLRAHEAFLPLLAELRLDNADFTGLGASEEQVWRDAVEARRGTLQEIKTVQCTGIPFSCD